MEIKIFQVDAFTNNVFSGNPAAVCPLDNWLDDDTLLNIAKENNLAETAYFVPDDMGYHLRWFTPEIEMDLCGHATLASAHVLFDHLQHKETIHFKSKSGPLSVSRNGDLMKLDFPSRPPVPSELPEIILNGIGSKPSKVFKARDYFLVYESESDVKNIEPDQNLLSQINIDPGGIIVTARGDKADFVSRFFTPGASVFEDPVTGSAHCSLIPYWSKILDKADMVARQISPRGGDLYCSLKGDRVTIAGNAKTYMTGQIYI